MPDREGGIYSEGNEELWWCFEQRNGESKVPC